MKTMERHTRITHTLGVAFLLVVLVSGFLWAPAASAEEGATETAPLQGKIVFQTSSGGEIYLINADGTDLRYLTTGLDPALSPDGNGWPSAAGASIPACTS